jgi:hypothetical protein
MSLYTPEATEAQTQEVNARIQWALFSSPTSLMRLLPRDQAAILDDTLVVTRSKPSARDRQLVGADDDQHLLGLFTDGPNEVPTIQAFASEILAVRYDPATVGIHEAGHRLDFDHSKRPAVVALFGHPSQAAAQASTGPSRLHIVERAQTSDSSCPVCALYRKCAHVTMMLDGIQIRAHLQHQIPRGLGGMIPLCRTEVDEARAQTAVVQTLLDGRSGEIRALQRGLDELQRALLGRDGTGWLSPEDVSMAHAQAYKCADKAFDLAHIFFLRQQYGSEEASQEAA